MNIVNGGLLKGNEEAGYQRDVPWAVSQGGGKCFVTRDPVKQTPGEDARRSITVTVAL
jgi:hypothetical protein